MLFKSKPDSGPVKEVETLLFWMFVIIAIILLWLITA